MPVNCDKCLSPCNGVEEIGLRIAASQPEAGAA
jgi:hypothetical protein